jgi:bifunctional DNase/RNase
MEQLLITEIWTIAQTNHGYVVFLRPVETDVAVPVIVGQLELQSIIIGSEGIVMPRPLTHDLLLNIFKRLNITLRQIEIHSLIDDTFHARLILDGKGLSAGSMAVDCRPSDAIALAVRKKCPIYLTAALVKKTGIPLDYFIDEIEKTSRQTKDGEADQSAQYHELIRQLNHAVEAEEYERAAEIRDILIRDWGQGIGSV